MGKITEFIVKFIVFTFAGALFALWLDSFYAGWFMYILLIIIDSFVDRLESLI